MAYVQDFSKGHNSHCSQRDLRTPLPLDSSGFLCCHRFEPSGEDKRSTKNYYKAEAYICLTARRFKNEIPKLRDA